MVRSEDTPLDTTLSARWSVRRHRVRAARLLSVASWLYDFADGVWLDDGVRCWDASAEWASLCSISRVLLLWVAGGYAPHDGGVDFADVGVEYVHAHLTGRGIPARLGRRQNVAAVVFLMETEPESWSSRACSLG